MSLSSSKFPSREFFVLLGEEMFGHKSLICYLPTWGFRPLRGRGARVVREVEQSDVHRKGQTKQPPLP